MTMTLCDPNLSVIQFNSDHPKISPLPTTRSIANTTHSKPAKKRKTQTITKIEIDDDHKSEQQEQQKREEETVKSNKNSSNSIGIQDQFMDAMKNAILRCLDKVILKSFGLSFNPFTFNKYYIYINIYNNNN